MIQAAVWQVALALTCISAYALTAQHGQVNALNVLLFGRTSHGCAVQSTSDTSVIQHAQVNASIAFMHSCIQEKSQLRCAVKVQLQPSAFRYAEYIVPLSAFARGRCGM